ncbi:MAG TPA: hypothetical protein VGE22_02685 [Solimonas sp.]
MLISYSMPSISGSTLTGAAWLTADGAAALWDGKPARRARLQWSAGSSLDAFVKITLAFTGTAALRVLALLGSNLPAGVRIDFRGAGGDGLGGTCDNARTTTMPDGTTGAWAIARANEPAETGVEILIYNDCNGVPWAANGTTIDIGEVWAAPAVEIAHKPDWGNELQDPSELTLTLLSQPNSVRRASYRTLDVPITAAAGAEVYSQGLGNGMDWYALQRQLAGNARCAVVVRRTSTYQLAQYGIGQLASIRHVGGDNYEGQFRHQEVPAR